MSITSLSILSGLIFILITSWIIPRAQQRYSIVLGTAAFLGYYAPVSLFILILTAVGTYYSTRYIINSGIATTISVSLLVMIFLLAKSTQNIFPFNSIPHLEVLGLFFYVLKQIHYVVERYKGKLAEHSFLDYLCYLFFLPTLLAGPVNPFLPFCRDIQRRRFDTELLSAGFERILYGYAKVAILANWLITQRMTAYITSLASEHTSLAAYLDCLRYGLNLYFQFSGYSDVAIGFALAMGFRIIENFNHPYRAININDFWQRWHISLSKWCRDYVFMSVIAITRKPILAVVSSMVVIGLWHELSLRYFVWALYHGLGIAVWHLFQSFKRRIVLPHSPWLRRSLAMLSIAITVNFVILSFALTKSQGLDEALRVYGTIFNFGE